jgi:hypothetical protein
VFECLGDFDLHNQHIHSAPAISWILNLHQADYALNYRRGINISTKEISISTHGKSLRESGWNLKTVLHINLYLRTYLFVYTNSHEISSQLQQNYFDQISAIWSIFVLRTRFLSRTIRDVNATKAEKENWFINGKKEEQSGYPPEKSKTLEITNDISKKWPLIQSVRDTWIHTHDHQKKEKLKNRREKM